MGTAPASLTTIAERVEARLRLLLDTEIERWRALDPEIVAPLESLGALLLAGGKRLRPAIPTIRSWPTRELRSSSFTRSR